MARGWESKAVEEQQSEFIKSPQGLRAQLTPEQLARRQDRDGLVLSRKRIVQQLEIAGNPQHRSMLQAALTALDTQIAQLG